MSLILQGSVGTQHTSVEKTGCNRAVVKTAVAVLAACAGWAAQAATIINIPGTQAGAEIYQYPVALGSEQTFFSPVMLSLSAGDYNISGAWGRPGALFDAWNFYLGAAGSWSNYYLIGEATGTPGRFTILANPGASPTPCVNWYCAWSTREEAAAGLLAAPPYRLHLDHDATLGFVVTDYEVVTNQGGVSLLVSAVPEPETNAMMLMGLGTLAAVARRRRRAGVDR